MSSKFPPTFIYTPKIINMLSKIERLYGQILGENLIPSLSLRLTKENQVLATHHSTSIEGNPLTPKDVTNIILGDQIPTTKSELEVNNYFKTLNKIYLLTKKNEKISLLLTKNLHKILMEGLDAKSLNEFRNGSVFIGHRTKVELVIKHNPPFHTKDEIAKALEKLYTWVNVSNELHPLIKAGILHHEFAYIHPFFDGNGRLARILTAYYLLLNNYEVAKYFILDDYYDIDRSQYSDMLHSADNGNNTKWLEYFLEGIAYSLQAAAGRISDLKRKNLDNIEADKRVLVTRREEEVLEILIDKKAIKTQDIVEYLVVTRQQAHSLLASLVKKGLVRKYGSTKTSYYKLKEKK